MLSHTMRHIPNAAEPVLNVSSSPDAPHTVASASSLSATYTMQFTQASETADAAIITP